MRPRRPRADTGRMTPLAPAVFELRTVGLSIAACGVAGVLAVGDPAPQDLRAGAVASVEGIIHPITAARLVMQHTNHVLLVGAPATAFASHFKLEGQPRRPRLRSAPRRGKGGRVPENIIGLFRSMMKVGLARREYSGRETVVAVALDRAGTVAAGAAVEARFAPGEMALLRNTSGTQTARLKLKVMGDTAALGMSYSDNP